MGSLNHWVANLAHLLWIEVLHLLLILEKLLHAAHLLHNSTELLELVKQRMHLQVNFMSAKQQNICTTKVKSRLQMITSISMTPAPQAILETLVGCLVNVLKASMSSSSWQVGRMMKVLRVAWPILWFSTLSFMLSMIVIRRLSLFMLSWSLT